MNSTKINARKIILIIALAFLNALSISQITEMTEISGLYFGSAIYGWNPSCMAFFALDCILLNRFLKKDVLKDKRRVFVSSLLGVLIGLLSVLGIGMYYGNSTIFDNATPPVLLFFLALGLSFLTIPILSELIGFLNAVCNKTDEISKKTSFFEKHPWVYFVIIWAIVFVSFMPLFLYWWPGNFVYDADYQVYDYLTDTISTHHPILHTLLLGKAYEWGYNRGNVNNGIMIYTLIQMFVLSSSVAFFMEYLCQRKVKKSIRLIILLTFVLNPVNAWFAISTIKGVLSAAFLIVSLTFLLRYFDCEKKEKIKKILSAIGFAVFCILSCHFRNNMIYAVILGGIIIVLLRKGVKEKLIFAALVVAIVIGFKGSNKILISATNASEKDTQRETFSVPLLCLARVAIKCRDKIG